MDTFANIQRARRLAWFGIVLTAMVAVAMGVLRVVNADTLTVEEVMAATALVAASAIPPVLAWLSLDRRPGLLPAASYSALVIGVVGFITLPVVLFAVVAWFSAAQRRPAERSVRAAPFRRLGISLLTAGAVFVLFAHADPVCTETRADGSTVRIDPVAYGFETGWSLSLGTSSSLESGSQPDDPVALTCSSDTVVLGEAVASLAITGVAIDVGRRWPVRTGSASEPRSATRIEG